MMLFEQIFSPDGTIQMGSIHYQWDQLLVGYNLCLTFPSRNTSSKEKALLLGATFLLVCITNIYNVLIHIIMYLLCLYYRNICILKQ